ncbi:hypothetical protein ACFY2R_18070 [Micromonospora olivasterospora]|uniref:Uncharacterized protein n=1 Tax=Micromonospora olivasterospora TaxID=1880 RepID=A0A562HVF9_MICOL|nr:hypothetical protein [Micromonospora olivasterospora]TWH62303.1 hypothetical protein JD77_06354 [Micromonospora olivasterospora]
MGRHLKPISDRKPAKQLALKLRELKGDIPFARLAKQVHVKPNTLSTMADGTYRGWQCVEQFLEAVRLCGVIVTEEDLSQCRTYHKIAEKLHRERGNPSLAASSEVPVLPSKTETVVLAPRVDEDDDSSVVTFTRTDPMLACPSSLAQARTVHDVVATLLDLITDKNMDIRSWRQSTTASWSTGRSGTPEWELLTARTEPTLPVVLSIVRQCGGGPADLARWEQQWKRIVTPGTRFVGTAKPPEESRSSEATIALTTAEPVSDDDLQRIRDHFGDPPVKSGKSRPPLWRRLAPSRVTRVLTRRCPGETLPPPD